MSDRMVEYGGTPSASALLSLARWAGVTLDEARAYASRNAIGELIAEVRAVRGPETRGASRGPGRGADPIVRLEWLYRRRVLSILSDRAAGLRA